MPVETHKDDTPFATGTHTGSSGSAYLEVRGADFKSCGVQEDVLIKNTTDGSSGTISSVTEDRVYGTLSGGTDNDWDYGDTYEIYITDTEDSVISSIYVDRRFGRRADREDMKNGILPKDEDLDEYTRHVFGPGQPESNH